MKNKIKVLFMSDYCDSGFGTVGKELCSRLAEMEIFELHYVGWHSTPQDGPEAAQRKIQLHNTRFWDATDQFATKSLDVYVENIKPDVIITLGDPWMTDHVGACKSRHRFVWLSYVPIDRDVISLPWREQMKKPDCLILYSKFGMEVVENQIPFRNPRLILHGVDKTVFKPWFPAGFDENTGHAELMRERKRFTLGEKFADKFIVGFVGRNQVRKDIPRMMRAFKAFNCATWVERKEIGITEANGESKKVNAEEFCRKTQCFRCDICPAFSQREETRESIVYLHTTRGAGEDANDRPGIGWRIDELAARLELHGRVAMTPGITAIKGVHRLALAQIMNCFDVHCFLSHSEGFGLPISETLSCGVPNLVTNFSSMPELVSAGGGVAIDVREYETFITWENEWALADIGHAADEINKIFSDTEYAISMRKAAAANDYVPDWYQVAQEFRALILEALGQQD